MENHQVICIARQFGSGGREIGQALAARLGMAFYDKELLQAAAEKSGIMRELFEKHDEKPAARQFMSAGPAGVPKAASFEDYTTYQPNDQMQNALADAIKEAASQSSCIIIGRCADHILRGRSEVLSVFIHADAETRVLRVARLHNLDEDAARALIRKTDRSRANYYSYYTGRNWGTVNNYDLALDGGRLGCEKAVQLLAQAVNLYCGG